MEGGVFLDKPEGEAPQKKTCSGTGAGQDVIMRRAE